jgi:hypothetical protein
MALLRLAAWILRPAFVETRSGFVENTKPCVDALCR